MKKGPSNTNEKGALQKPLKKVAPSKSNKKGALKKPTKKGPLKN